MADTAAEVSPPPFVRHADGTQADYTVTRALVTQTNTTVSVTGGVGYIDCDSFGTQTGTYFQDGVRKYDSAVRTWTRKQSRSHQVHR